MVGEACAHVQGESLKAYAALLTEASQLPDHQDGELSVSSFPSILALMMAIATLESGCGDGPIPANVAYAGGSFGSIANLLQPGTVCFIHHQNTPGTPYPLTTVYTGADGRAVPLTPEQCRQADADAQIAEQQAQQQRAAETQRAAQLAQADQQRRDAAAAQIVREEEARGYKHVTVKDLLLDGKVYAANETKVSVSGFYHAQNRQNARLYDSYNDFMMHTMNPSAFGYVEALNVGLISEDGSRTLREFLLRCVAGCGVTILGHIGQCVETNAFGRQSDDFCLVAEDMRPQ